MFRIERVFMTVEEAVKSTPIRSLPHARFGREVSALDLEGHLPDLLEGLALELEQVLNSRFISFYQPKASYLHNSLAYGLEILELASLCQLSWLDYEYFFAAVGNDIRYNKEQKIFQQNDVAWRKFMRSLKDNGLKKWVDDYLSKSFKHLLEGIRVVYSQLDNSFQQLTLTRRIAVPRAFSLSQQ